MTQVYTFSLSPHFFQVSSIPIVDSPKPLPKHTVPPSLEELVSREDPYMRFSGLQKIGEGFIIEMTL